MSMSHKKKVPYSKNYQNDDPDVALAHLYVGPRAWEAKQDINNRSLILPPHEQPQIYDWRFLAGQWVVVWVLGQTERTYRRRLAYELLTAGAVHVLIRLPRSIQQSVVAGNIVFDEVANIERYSR